MSENLFSRRYPGEIAAELFCSCLWEDIIPSGAAHKAAYYLFQELVEQIGIRDAQRAFLHFGNGPSPRQLKQFKNKLLLDRLDMMKGGPNVQQLAEQIAQENAEFNKALPPERNSEAQPTNQMSIDKHIRRLVDQRKAHRARTAARRLVAQGQTTQPLRKKKTARKTRPASKQLRPKSKGMRG
jgi:hypothetical protein